MSKSEASRLPVDPRTGQPLPPRAQPGYYPGYSTLGQKAFWDEATRNLVVRRVEEVPPIRFFTPEEAQMLRAVCDRILPQDDRDTEHRIPVVEGIDRRLAENEGHGYRFEGMPTDGDAHRLGMKGIEAIARHMFHKSFTELSPLEQDQVIETLHHNSPPAGEEVWQHLSIMRYWMLLVQDAVEAYYSHPWAWDEIGFGGPAYPRPYFRLENGQPEPWEVKERRYEWKAPPESLSGKFEPIGGTVEHRATPGQEGTH